MKAGHADEHFHEVHALGEKEFCSRRGQSPKSVRGFDLSGSTHNQASRRFLVSDTRSRDNLDEMSKVEGTNDGGTHFDFSGLKHLFCYASGIFGQ